MSRLLNHYAAYTGLLIGLGTNQNYGGGIRTNSNPLVADPNPVISPPVSGIENIVKPTPQELALLRRTPEYEEAQSILAGIGSPPQMEPLIQAINIDRRVSYRARLRLMVEDLERGLGDKSYVIGGELTKEYFAHLKKLKTPSSLGLLIPKYADQIQ